jgi:hypothetical protein
MCPRYNIHLSIQYRPYLLQIVYADTNTQGLHKRLYRRRVFNDFFLNNQPNPLIIPNLFCYKTLRVLNIYFAHHQEISTVHSALVSFMKVLITVSKQSQDGILLGKGQLNKIK